MVKVTEEGDVAREIALLFESVGRKLSLWSEVRELAVLRRINAALTTAPGRIQPPDQSGNMVEDDAGHEDTFTTAPEQKGDER